eukprot:scaffold6121_cov170-Amphora_coffeaeformis.AAC.2
MTGRLALSFILISDSLVRTFGLSMYLSYQDAVCTDSDNIAGTAVLSYDDSYYNELLSMSYEYAAECLYLKGGYIDIESYSYDNVDDYYGFGQCIKCNGVVGCSSDGTCSNFMTYPGEMSNGGYQLTQGGGSSTKDESVRPKMGLAMKAQDATVNAMQSPSKNKREYSGVNATSAFLIGGVIVVGLAIAVAGGVYAGRRRVVAKLNDAVAADQKVEGKYHLSTELGTII